MKSVFITILIILLSLILIKYNTNNLQFMTGDAKVEIYETFNNPKPGFVCEKDEENSCPVAGNWSLQYWKSSTFPPFDEVFCQYACISFSSIEEMCTTISEYDYGCSTLEIKDDGTYVATDENGITNSGNWTGNGGEPMSCDVGSQFSVVIGGDPAGLISNATIYSLNSNELILRNIIDVDPVMYTDYVFTK